MTISAAFMLALAVALFLLGPVLFRTFQNSPRVLGTLDGFVIVAIAGLVFFHILPMAFQSLGLVAVGLMLLGLIFPTVVERSAAITKKTTHKWLVMLILGGLILHMALDGVILASSHSSHGFSLKWAIVLHQLPEGAALWWILSRTWGKKWAIGGLVASAAVLILGYGAASIGFAGWEGGTLWHGIEIFVAGALLHVLMHQIQNTGPTNKRFEVLGGVLGGGLVVTTTFLGAEHLESGYLADYLHRFYDLVLTTAPALLFGYVLAGLVVAFLPRASLVWLKQGGSIKQAIRGLIFGLPLPICSCGVVPLYQSLIKRGVPIPAALAFLVATPELGIDAILISFPLLGVELTLIRLAGAALVALAVGVLVGSWIQASSSEQALDEDEGMGYEPEDGESRLKMALNFGLNRVVNDTAPWIIAGLAIAAAISPDLLGPSMADLPFGVDVLLFALVGIPLYVCASGSTPLAAAFILAGVSPGAAIAFLLAGPASNVTTFGILSELHGRRAALYFGVVMFGSAVATGLAVNAFMGDFTLAVVASEAHDHGGLFYMIAAALLGILFLRSLLKVGVRGYFETIFSLGASHAHDNGEGCCDSATACSGSGHQHTMSCCDHHSPSTGPGLKPFRPQGAALGKIQKISLPNSSSSKESEPEE